MSETATLDQTQTATQTDPQDQVVTATQQVTQTIGDSLWGMQTTPYVNPEPPAQVPVTTNEPVVADPNTPAPETDDIVDLDVYFQREFGMNPTDFRTKWDEFNKPKEPGQPQEQKWVYDDSKEDEIFNYINQKRQLDRLEKYDVTDANQAAEIIRANLQYKYKDLQPQDIDRLFARQYSMPAQPQQNDLQTDEEFAVIMNQWKQQVQDKQADMILDAKLAKPELLQYKSQIVQPEISKPQVQQTGPTQEELQAAEAGRKAYLDAVGGSYQNFKGFNVTAKSGDAQLPISYDIKPEEQIASKTLIEDFNPTSYFEKRWFDGTNPRVNLIQEDLYLLENRDKIFQAIANGVAQKMDDYLTKQRNNINLKSVNSELGPLPNKDQQQNVSTTLAQNIWAM